MTFTQDAGEVSASFRPVADVDGLTMKSGTRARFVAPGSATRGQFGIFEWNMPAASGGASPHFHKTFSESFYIISGTVGLYDGARWVSASAGDFLYVPEGGVHGFSNDADSPASMLIIFAPGAPRERYFQEVAENAAAGRVLTDEEWVDLFTRHDQYPVES